MLQDTPPSTMLCTIVDLVHRCSLRVGYNKIPSQREHPNLVKDLRNGPPAGSVFLFLPFSSSAIYPERARHPFGQPCRQHYFYPTTAFNFPSLIGGDRFSFLAAVSVHNRNNCCSL